MRAEVARLRDERIPRVDRSSRRRDRRLTIAYVFVAILAVSIAGLGAASALEGTNTVFGDDIVNGTVTTQDLRDGTVVAVDVRQPVWQAVAANTVTSGGPEPCANGSTATFCGIAVRKWANFGNGFQGARFSKDVTNRVHLEGLVKEVFAPDYQGGVLPTPIFVLPVGYRPTARLVFPIDCSSDAGPTHGRIDVLANGRVTYEGLDCSSSGYMSLAGISFRSP